MHGRLVAHVVLGPIFLIVLYLSCHAVGLVSSGMTRVQHVTKARHRGWGR